MFSRFALFTAASMAVLVAASNGDSQNSCNTGTIQCCNSLTSTDSPEISEVFGLLGISSNDITGNVGVECSPITVGGQGKGSTCTGHPVCCSNNRFNGVLAFGCNPINVDL